MQAISDSLKSPALLIPTVALVGYRVAATSVNRADNKHVPKVYTARFSRELPLKRGSKDFKDDPISLAEFLQERCPSLFRAFTPASWLFNGHLQTVYCVMGNFSNIDKVVYDRQFIRLQDGGTLGLDSTPPQAERTLPNDTPIVVVTHGLTGGSHESYVRNVLAPAVRPNEKGGLGYRGIVVNFRGCAGVPLSTPQLYSAGHTDDLRQALMYISKKYAQAPLYGVGFSLGASVLVNYLGEEGNRSRLRAGCSIGAPWDIQKLCDQIEGTAFSRQTYSKVLGSNLQKLASRHLHVAEKFPGTRLLQAYHDILKMKSPGLYDSDDAFVRVVGGTPPTFPFPSVPEYYKWASCVGRLPGVRVPLLAINAEDDPIVGHVLRDVPSDGHVALVTTAGGGHLGWFEQGDGLFGVRRWISRPVLEWLRAVHEELDVEVNPAPLEEVDGWIREVGQDRIGCREVEGVIQQIEGSQAHSTLLQGL